MANKNWVIIISGPNGAGKSTFHNRILLQNPFLADSEFINYDQEFAGLKQNTSENTDEERLRRHALMKMRLLMALRRYAHLLCKEMGKWKKGNRKRVNKKRAHIKNAPFFYGNKLFNFAIIPLALVLLQARWYFQGFALPKLSFAHVLHAQTNLKKQTN